MRVHWARRHCRDLRCGQPCRGRARRVGFTLIEVLVVVAIIALLVGILLPSLTAAREQAKRAVCQANLHSLDQALYLYALEQKSGHMPWRPNVSAYYWIVWTKGGNATISSWKGEMTKYIANTAMLECPSDRGDNIPGLANPVWKNKLFDYWGTSYYYNCRDNLTTDDPLPGSIPRARISQFDKPSRLVLAGDTTLSQHGRGGGERHLWHHRRKPWANLAFADGHVAYHLMDPDAPPEASGKPLPLGCFAVKTSLHGKGFDFVNEPTDPCK